VAIFSAILIIVAFWVRLGWIWGLALIAFVIDLLLSEW